MIERVMTYRTNDGRTFPAYKEATEHVLDLSRGVIDKALKPPDIIKRVFVIELVSESFKSIDDVRALISALSEVVDDYDDGDADND